MSGNVILHITETNNYYFDAYATNHKIGIKGLQISINNGKFVDVERKTHNRFVYFNKEQISLVKVKLISISNEEIICYNQNAINKGDYDCGAQFVVKNFYALCTSNFRLNARQKYQNHRIARDRLLSRKFKERQN